MSYFEDLFTLLDDGWEPSEGEGFRFGENENICNWIVLSVNDNKILAINNRIVEYKPFDKEGNNNWECSSLREWLNGEFAIDSFITDPESETLEDSMLTKNENGDFVSLLSFNETEEYQDTLSELGGPTTLVQLHYAEALEESDFYEDGHLAYWLMPEDGQFSYVDQYGDSTIITKEDLEDDNSGEYWKEMCDFSKPLGIRPTILIDLNNYIG